MTAPHKSGLLTIIFPMSRPPLDPPLMASLSGRVMFLTLIRSSATAIKSSVYVFFNVFYVEKRVDISMMVIWYASDVK